jgi:predicted Rdx family selenoprotein
MLVRAIIDGCKWLSQMPGYPLQKTMKTISDEILKVSLGGGGGGILSVHYDIPIFLPHSFDTYDGSYFTSPLHPPLDRCH